MNILVLFTAIVLLIYTLYVFWCLLGWRKSRIPGAEANKAAIDISIILPVRNEADSIEKRILQLLPEISGNSELIIVNDGSTDGTADILQRHRGNAAIKLLDVQHGTGKKAAIKSGIQVAKNELVLTTDADVQSGRGLLKEVGVAFNNEAEMLLLPVFIPNGQGLLGQAQVMDQAILSGMALGSAGMGTPVWGSGAALAFRKSAFEEVNGYIGNENTPSGDDVFLLHKFKAAGKKVIALNSPDATVLADPCRTWAELVAQRLRWGSKSKHYRDPFTLFVSALGLSRWFALPLAFILSVQGFGLLGFLAVTTILADLLLTEAVVRAHRLKLSWWARLVVPVFYLFFGLFLIVASFVHTPQWKGRKVTA